MCCLFFLGNIHEESDKSLEISTPMYQMAGNISATSIALDSQLLMILA